MNYESLRSIVSQAITSNPDDGKPAFIAQKAVLLADPGGLSPWPMELAANLEFRQIARELLRETHAPENPADKEPPQHLLFPGLQAMYPRHVAKGEDAEYVKPEQLSSEDVEWNIARLRAGAKSLQRSADALEAWAGERGLLAA